MSTLKMPSINQVAVSGVLCQEPESHLTEDGKLRVSFNIAINSHYRDGKGEWQQETTFTPVVVWDKLAEYSAQHLKKGSAVFLTGRLKSRTFETHSGNRTVLEVIAQHIQFLSKKEEAKEKDYDADDDEIPF